VLQIKRGIPRYKGDMSQWGEVAVSFEVTREGLSGKRHSRRDLEKAMQVSRNKYSR